MSQRVDDLADQISSGSVFGGRMLTRLVSRNTTVRWPSIPTMGSLPPIRESGGVIDAACCTPTTMPGVSRSFGKW